MKPAHGFVLASLLLILRSSAISQAPNKAEIDQLKVQIETLKQQQALSQQIIDSLEKKIDAMERRNPNRPLPFRQSPPSRINRKIGA